MVLGDKQVFVREPPIPDPVAGNPPPHIRRGVNVPTFVRDDIKTFMMVEGVDGIHEQLPFALFTGEMEADMQNEFRKLKYLIDHTGRDCYDWSTVVFKIIGVEIPLVNPFCMFEGPAVGDVNAQYLVGEKYGLGILAGVRKNLPLGKRYLELGAAQGDEDAVALLKELRKCVACGELDVHHLICSRCRNRRYCGKDCQRQHWNSPVDPHSLHCVPRRESAGAGGSSDRVVPPAHLVSLEDQIAAAAAARVAGNDLFREQKYPEVGPLGKYYIRQNTVVKHPVR